MVAHLSLISVAMKGNHFISLTWYGLAQALPHLNESDLNVLFPQVLNENPRSFSYRMLQSLPGAIAFSGALESGAQVESFQPLLGPFSHPTHQSSVSLK